jgi:hypothetical protein
MAAALDGAVATAPAAAGRETAAGLAASGRPVFEVEGLDIEYTTELGTLRAVRGVSLTVH